MHTPVIRPPRLHSRLHLRGAVAGRRITQGCGVLRQQAVHQLLCLCPEPPHHGGRGPLHVRAPHHTLDLPIGIQADVAHIG